MAKPRNQLNVQDLMRGLVNMIQGEGPAEISIDVEEGIFLAVRVSELKPALKNKGIAFEVLTS